MARHKKVAPAEEPDASLISHLRSLGLQTPDEYRKWCVRNGFPQRLDKSWSDRDREYAHSREGILRRRLEQSRRETRNADDILMAICDGALTARDVSQPHLQRLCGVLAAPAGSGRPIDREALRDLLLYLRSQRVRLFDANPVVGGFGRAAGNTYIEALAQVAAFRDAWIRPLHEWRARSHSARRQFPSLLRHLLVRYDMPEFFDSAWFAQWPSGPGDRREWYLHVGRGENIRHCALPVPYSKRMSHFFMQAPDDYTVDQALRFGQVRSLGGDEALARSLLGTRLGRSFEHDEFWMTVIDWIIAHPEVSPGEVGPIVDYIQDQRFGPEWAAAGEVPDQPHLCMKGRTPAAMRARVREWHHKLGRHSGCHGRHWRPSGFRPFEFVEGAKSSDSYKRWTIRELLSGRALLTEGRTMKHCVASYAPACQSGDSSIWALEVEVKDGTFKALTVQVRNAMRQIVQARGKLNRQATDKERSLLSRWATAAGLTMASYV